MALISDAPSIWKLLKGVVCLYKPAGVHPTAVRNILLGNLSSDLCELDCRPPVKHVYIEGDTTNSLSVHVAPSFADHPLVVGPRYQARDFRCTWGTNIGKNVSGVFVLGLGKGNRKVMDLHKQKPVRVYRVKGLLGKATENYFVTGKVLEKATFRHVQRSKLDTILATIQAAHQKQMFQRCGIDMQSQAAYELATQGLIKPADHEIPVLYNIKCVDFQPPEFTLEVHCVNEHEMYLRTLIHDVGCQVHSAATCTGLQCIRYDTFTLEHALLRKHWRLQHVLDNMAQNEELLQKTQAAERKESAILKQYNVSDFKVEVPDREIEEYL